MGEYRERLTAPLSWWIGAVLFGVVCGWIVTVAATPTVGVVAGLVGTAIAAALVWAYGNLVVHAGPDGFHVGNAHLTPEFTGEVTVLDGPAFRAILGPDADARAFLRTRSYVTGGVRVEVNDPRDPVPYWLVSSRRPESVAAALADGSD